MQIPNDLKPHLNWQEIVMVASEEQRHAPRSKQLSRKPRFELNDSVGIIE